MCKIFFTNKLSITKFLPSKTTRYTVKYLYTCQVKTSTCVTGPAVLYGAVLPYLFDVVVHEHYMITGNWMNKDEQPNEEQQQLAISFMSEIG